MGKKKKQQKQQYKSFLIVKCVELGDQWECDADRIPMMIVEDWTNCHFDYLWEAYAINNRGLIVECVKDYEDEPIH